MPNLRRQNSSKLSRGTVVQDPLLHSSSGTGLLDLGAGPNAAGGFHSVLIDTVPSLTPTSMALPGSEHMVRPDGLPTGARI